MEEKNIVWLSEIGRNDIPIAGGKGANLAELFNAGLPVPPAFVITADAYKKFLAETGIGEKIFGILNSIDLENTSELEEKAKQVREIVIKAEMPASLAEEISDSYESLGAENADNASEILKKTEPYYVAVRSSATTEDLSTASFAGQHETFVNIRGAKNVIEAVKKCWASIFTGRAVYYRKKNNFSHESSFIAVIIEKMVNSEKSGVIFTLNPLTNDKNEIIIEAVFGLGEGIVSGSIEPDNYVFTKSPLAMKSKRMGKKKLIFCKDYDGNTVKEELPPEKQNAWVLNELELMSLANCALEIEEHYKWPQDIEWAMEEDKVYIVQTRPVTTTEKEMKKVDMGKANSILSGLAASSGLASGTVRIVHSIDDLSKIQKGDILVTKMTNPDMVVSMQKASAIVTDEGGLTCHAAIVSREVGVPCIVGTKNATQILKDGQIITVDGTNGKVYDGKIEEKPKEIKETPKPNLASMLIPPEVKAAFDAAKKRKEQDGNKKILVKVNCDLPDSAGRAAATNADGIGLVRIEFIIAENGIHPAEYIRKGEQGKYSEILANGIGKIAHAFGDKPVWVRTSDIRTDEYRNLHGSDQEPQESNPMLGWHGIRRALDEPELLKAEFKAIKMLHEMGYKNVGIMIPFVISVDELKKAKQLCREIGLEPNKDVEFGVMIETPASCMIIEDLCKEGIDFISFGTNDLTQLTLGIDRNNERIAPLYNEMHPGVLSLIEMAMGICKMYGVRTSICGQAGSNPAMAKFLAKKGISSISANIDAVQSIREAVEEFL